MSGSERTLWQWTNSRFVRSAIVNGACARAPPPTSSRMAPAMTADNDPPPQDDPTSEDDEEEIVLVAHAGFVYLDQCEGGRWQLTHVGTGERCCLEAPPQSGSYELAFDEQGFGLILAYGGDGLEIENSSKWVEDLLHFEFYRENCGSLCVVRRGKDCVVLGSVPNPLLLMAEKVVHLGDAETCGSGAGSGAGASSGGPQYWVLWVVYRAPGRL